MISPIVLSRSAAALICSVGLSVIVGWIFDIEPLKHVVPGYVAMKANTATAFILAGLALWQLPVAPDRRGARRFVQGGALFIFLIGALTLVEYLFGWNLGIDELFFTEPSGAIGTSSAGRMGFNTAANFVLIGSALLLHTRRADAPAQSLAVGAVSIAFFPMIGYLYGVDSLYGIASHTQMALHTSVTFILFGVGLILSRPDAGIMAIMTAETHGGLLARRMLPLAVAVPVVVGWLRWQGEAAGLYQSRFGVALFALSNVFILTAVLWRTARVLHQTDMERKRAEEALRRAHDELELRVQDRTADLTRANQALQTEIGERKRAEETLRSNEGLLRTILETLPVGVWVTDSRGRIVSGNRAGQEIWAGAKYVGIDRYGEYKGWWADTGKRIEPEEWALARAVTRGERSLGEVIDIECFDGTRKTILNSAVPIRSSGGEIAGAIVVHQDITPLRQAERTLRENNLILENAVEGIAQLDEKGHYVSVNRAYAGTFGYEPSDLIGRGWEERVSPEDRDKLTAAYEEMKAKGKIETEVRGLRKGGDLFYEQIVMIASHDPHKKFTGHYCFMKDITERKRAEAHLNYLASFDSLTRLPNRTLFYDRLSQALARERWHRRLLAVLFLDLDRFKIINDTLGHGVGDLLLKGVAERLTASVRDGDTVARYGGDEFTLILADVAHMEDVARVTQKILNALSKPFDLQGHELFVTASIGIALYPNDGDHPEALIKNADAAMYRAKEGGRNHYQLYSPALNAKASERLLLESHLRRALERQEFLLYYQPKVDLGSGAVVGMEALIRWKRPEQGMVSPAEFIPLAEETGLILPIGEWALRTAARQVKRWQEAGVPAVPVAVNLSPRQFQLNLVEMISRVLSEVGLAPPYLGLEVTEGMMMKQAAAAANMLDRLHEIGIEIAIDDFGTGYSSLSYLKRFHVQSLKIDGSFIRDLSTHPDDAAIVAAIITMARSLKLTVVAEAVETEEQLSLLRSLQCDQMQGYLFSRPLPADETEKLLRGGKRLATGIPR
jgi:diguanylate cyclase (GGDEF)-like protein/PAS domain S-box-containing protein